MGVDMQNVLKKLRGILGIGITWAIAWSALGALLATVQALILASSYPQVRGALSGAIALNAIFIGVYGFLTGSLSGAILSIAERRHTISQLTTRRFALWGGIAGAAIPAANLLLIRILGGGFPNGGAIVTVASSLLGAISAAALLRIARAGTPATAESPEPLRSDRTAKIHPPGVAATFSALQRKEFSDRQQSR
jgi:hypothetical protein